MMPEEKRLSDSAILHRVLNTQEYRRAHTVFAFVGRADEIDTRPLLEQILADGKRLCASPDVMERLKVSKEKVLFSLENRTFGSCWADSPARGDKLPLRGAACQNRETTLSGGFRFVTARSRSCL